MSRILIYEYLGDFCMDFHLGAPSGRRGPKAPFTSSYSGFNIEFLI